MAVQPIEEMLKQANYSIYNLCRMAASRALELTDGKKPLIVDNISEKETTTALEEIIQGKIVCKDASKDWEQFISEKPSQDETDTKAA